MDPTSSLLSDRELAAWRGMLETHSRLVSELDAELERHHGLPLTSYEVLMYLGDADGIRGHVGSHQTRLAPAGSQASAGATTLGQGRRAVAVSAGGRLAGSGSRGGSRGTRAR